MSARAETEFEVFFKAMRHEIAMNARKGTWKETDLDSLMTDVIYHLVKLQKAVEMDDKAAILELAADVANCSMFVADVAGALRKDLITGDIAYIGTQDMMRQSAEFFERIAHREPPGLVLGKP